MMRRVLPSMLMLVCGAGSLAGQACLEAGASYAIRGAASAVRYEGPNDLTGSTVGVELAWSPAPASLLLGVSRVSVDASQADPVVGRAEVALPGFAFGGARLCASALAGVSRLETDEDAATTVAGGVGITVSRGVSLRGLDVVPFVQLRGLAGTVTGRIVDEDLSGTGVAVGLEWGLALRLRGLALRGSLALDGFDQALGVSPFPARAFRLAAGYGF